MYEDGIVKMMAGDTVLSDIPLRGATFEHVVKRDIPEMWFGLIAGAVATPLVMVFAGDMCGGMTAIVALLFAGIMWTKGHYLVVTEADGETHDLYVADDDADEIELFILRLVNEQLALEEE